MVKNNLIIASLALASCSAKLPKMDVELWDFEPEKSEIIHHKDGRVLACSDESLKKFLAMTTEDFKEIMTIMGKCKDWGDTPMMTPENLMDAAIEMMRQDARGRTTSTD